MNTVNAIVGSVLVILGVILLVLAVIIGSGICSTSGGISALFGVTPCSQAAVEILGFIVGGISLIIAGGIILYKETEKNFATSSPYISSGGMRNVL